MAHLQRVRNRGRDYKPERYKKGGKLAAPFADVKTVLFDIEETHYRRKITLSNRQMIDGCNTLICYVNPLRTGAAQRRLCAMQNSAA